MARIRARGRKGIAPPLDGLKDGAQGLALDLGHLDRQCMGDKALAAEVLQQFRVQAAALIETFAREGSMSSREKADIAHRLRGSALAVGAFPVAEAAAAVETRGRESAPLGDEGSKQGAELSQAIARLSEAVSRAVAEMDRLPPDPDK